MGACKGKVSKEGPRVQGYGVGDGVCLHTVCETKCATEGAGTATWHHMQTACDRYEWVLVQARVRRRTLVGFGSQAKRRRPQRWQVETEDP